MILLLGVWTFLRALLGRSTAVTLENVALRHQLEVLRRATPRLRLRRRARIFWVCLSRLWTNWRASLVLAHPQRSSHGIAKASSSTGAGSPDHAYPVAPSICSSGSWFFDTTVENSSMSTSPSQRHRPPHRRLGSPPASRELPG